MATKNEQIDFDPNSLTMGELIDIEDATGLNVAGVEMERMPLKAMVGLVWVIRRRENPELSFEDMRDVKAVEFDLGKSQAGQESLSPRPRKPSRKQPTANS